jgi:hypothetical protein
MLIALRPSSSVFVYHQMSRRISAGSVKSVGLKDVMMLREYEMRVSYEERVEVVNRGLCFM